MNRAEPIAEHAAPLFILSFRQRDELAALAAGAGWHVVAARRAEGAPRRWLASGSPVAVVDARGAFDDGLAATAALAEVGQPAGGAILVLVSSSDQHRLSALYDAGATQFLVSPMRDAVLLQAIRFAARQAERGGSDWRRAPLSSAEPLGWRYDPKRRSLQLTPGLATIVDLPESTAPRAALRRLNPIDRIAGVAALRRLGDGLATTAFAHDIHGLGRVVEHVQRDTRTGRVHALIEPIGSVPDAGAALRDAFGGIRDEIGARRWIGDHLGDGQVTLALVGLSRLDRINTEHGRSAGDAALRAASRRIGDIARELLGRDGIVARLGGSEFVVATATQPDRLRLAAGRIETALARPFVAGDAIAPLGVRVMVLSSRAGDTASDLLRRVGEQLAERAGGQTPSGDHPLDGLALDLRGALDRDEIAIRFQPQVAVTSGAIVGVEALARWNHPSLGELGAETLLATAQRGGMDVALSDHLQTQALRSAARWPAALSRLRLAINITADDVARPGFADILLDRIDSSGFPRARLTIEVTESGLIDDLGSAAALLSELRAAGCRVAIDDFGTGYSSLAYLKALPLDYLKIDKKLSQDIAGTPRDRVVVRGVIDMARSLGLAVVAEGVETAEQLDLLAKEGCQYYQGFLCAEPLDANGLLALIEGMTT
ncbi:putative bifunctional diguanylate cyclase/phosphodiesterase [Sphingomonas japonica]|uniref:EAL domain-containing protein (Putative c-di-GMP-specific phosphodiesterase class I)/GGDEF domain-containing protein/DNA-binding NarL/FixJ family response regulator n=1 Tax=Sphingomonas japonica TaxID=511662 RepID=A0ABX0U237_9SPHN|nr:GGDEF domain-containing phosphodiesterase [Sphingomonas japonica]NIJ24570.1 EAL domain-containing protein (putative c-di-GMP-specific phosphodiesterase class I)/GGDEF domain-containing protein/DNA-binding NarL/FixJ family response regulator [Sphingomonas japonica]